MAKTHPNINDPNAFVLYRYHPSLAAAIIFIVLFTTSTIIHIVQAVRTRARFLIPFIIGGIFEILGYVGRAQSSQDQWNLGAFIQQSVLLLVAPALFAASIYMTLGRIILLLDGEKYSVVKKRYLTKIFVAGDIFSFLLQSG
ncbi:RTA1-domain-containing protein, partial [Glonium stellatum]